MLLVSRFFRDPISEIYNKCCVFSTSNYLKTIQHFRNNLKTILFLLQYNVAFSATLFGTCFNIADFKTNFKAFQNMLQYSRFQYTHHPKPTPTPYQQYQQYIHAQSCTIQASSQFGVNDRSVHDCVRVFF